MQPIVEVLDPLTHQNATLCPHAGPLAIHNGDALTRDFDWIEQIIAELLEIRLSRGLSLVPACGCSRWAELAAVDLYEDFSHTLIFLKNNNIRIRQNYFLFVSEII